MTDPLWEAIKHDILHPSSHRRLAPDEKLTSTNDRAPSRKRVQKGRITPHAVLDLHGHTLESAKNTILAFLKEAQRRQHRLVLIITGKGRHPDQRTIRSACDLWLTEPPLRSYITWFAPAAPKHGSDGARYVAVKIPEKTV